jgi:ABC-type antimicrobial peptide transport system permease subunit
MNSALLYRGIGKRYLRNKVKTFLQMLGVTVGVFTLTSGLALGSGFQTAVLEYFGKVFLPDSITLATAYGVADPRGLSEDDVAALMQALPAITAWSPLVSGGRVALERNGNLQNASMTGTAPGAQTVMGHAAVQGEYFSDEDVRTRARVVLLGNTVREKLFGAEDPVGQPLAIGSQVYVVKGVLNRFGADPHGGDLDNVVVIPYTTLMQINKRDELGNARFRVGSSGEVERVAESMRGLMRVQHNIGDGRQDDFYVSTTAAGQVAFQGFLSMFNMLLPVVTGIILLIAMLVIASLTLISVKERTAEIGLRKAVGARARDIEKQILTETVGVALLGGLLGIVLSYPGAVYVEGLYARYGSTVSFLPSTSVLAISLICALLTGALAALLPARRAAALSSVEALR